VFFDNPAPFTTTLINAALTGAVDGDRGMLSFWMKQKTQLTETRLLYDFGVTHVVMSIFTNDFSVTLQNDAGTELLHISSGGGFSIGSWVHGIASWIAGSRAQMYINGSSAGVSVFANNAGTYDYGGGLPTRSDLLVTGPDGDVADFYLNLTDSLDLTNAANLQKFRSAIGKPVYLGADGSLPTGSAPICFLSKTAADTPLSWATNKGTGGGRAPLAAGVLANSTSSPSD
jgi:hypothetical protein